MKIKRTQEGWYISVGRLYIILGRNPNTVPSSYVIKHITIDWDITKRLED